MKIMAFDPGGGTGYAMWLGDPSQGYDPEDVVMGCLSDKDHHYQLECLLKAELTINVPDLSMTNRIWFDPPNQHLNRIRTKRVARDVRVVYEGFDNTGNIAAELISMEYIGVIKAFCQKYKIEHVRTNRANKDIRYLKGVNLRDFGVWPESKDAKDAARHLLWYMIHVVGYDDLLFYRQRRIAGME